MFLVIKISNLFIIGNGFDLSHNMQTKYKDFRRYLEHIYPKIKEHYITNVPAYDEDQRGGYSVDEEEVADFFFNVFFKY